MSNGEKTHTAMQKAIVKDLMKNWDLDWDGVVDSAYNGFIDDLRDDIIIDIKFIDADENAGEIPAEEVVLTCMINDQGDMPDIGNPFLLSDILVHLFTVHDGWQATRMLKNTLAAFKKKAHANNIDLSDMDF